MGKVPLLAGGSSGALLLCSHEVVKHVQVTASVVLQGTDRWRQTLEQLLICVSEDLVGVGCMVLHEQRYNLGTDTCC